MTWKCERCEKGVSLDKADYSYIDSSIGRDQDIRLCLDCYKLFKSLYSGLVFEFMNLD